ncbi:hypothetical protein RRF57_001742 [Xylaria bambusicola]|uniref:C4-dicarboxylate transporter/malic acid transport protein n=1 Tax=Xylaria bambusicola TaxID=326684 RepID=A0AAN7UHP2_9PEZI
MFILVIYFQRLIVYRIPPREVIVSVFLPLGPPGYGAFVVIQLGKDALKVFEPNQFVPAAPFAGQVLYTVGIMMALIMWGFGLLWLFFAVAAISRQKFPFNLGWWGFTFPLGVYAVATTTLGRELPSTFFKNLGTALSLVVALLWIVVSIGTIRHAWLGEFTQAPVIPEWEANKLAHKERPSHD